MFVVALHRFSGEDEHAAEKLASALGGTVYDARLRLRVPGGGPAVVALFAQETAATGCAEKLRQAGFLPLVLAETEVETDRDRFLVRRFALGEHHLAAESTDGRHLDLLYQDVDLLLRGSDIVRITETETVKEKKFDAGRALASGGLLMTKTHKRVQSSTTENRENFFLVFSPERPALVFRENVVSFESLGERMKLTRGLNFAFLLEEFRRRCPGALFDERLSQRLGQTQILGVSLPPEKHLDTAISLVAMSLRSEKWGRV